MLHSGGIVAPDIGDFLAEQCGHPLGIDMVSPIVTAKRLVHKHRAPDHADHVGVGVRDVRTDLPVPHGQIGLVRDERSSGRMVFAEVGNQCPPGGFVVVGGDHYNEFLLPTSIGIDESRPE